MNNSKTIEKYIQKKYWLCLPHHGKEYWLLESLDEGTNVTTRLAYPPLRYINDWGGNTYCGWDFQKIIEATRKDLEKFGYEIKNK